MTIDEFQQIDLRVARILAAERLPGSDKLLKLRINLGGEERQIIAGVGKAYEPETLVGKEIAVVVNMEPRVFTLRHGSGQVVLESQGMLLAAHGEDGTPVILTVEREVPPGSRIT